jgi:hypothetical protein
MIVSYDFTMVKLILDIAVEFAWEKKLFSPFLGMGRDDKPALHDLKFITDFIGLWYVNHKTPGE